jgi:predicted AAA+ superfamily ATPase
MGSRGVGKTTMLLQYIKNELFKDGKCFYFSADSVYFQQTILLEFVRDLHVIEGYQVIFIDEVHKYQGWAQELKNIYDSFPSLKIVFSGSSMLDLVKGSHDLSRRAKLYRLHGLSFREYLNVSLDLSLPTFDWQVILENPSLCVNSLKGLTKIPTHFEDYMRKGYYPFVLEDSHSYYEKLSRVIEKTIFEDIAGCYNINTQNLHVFKKLLSYFASIPPGELNVHSLAGKLKMDSKTIEHYLHILTSVKLTREMSVYEGGGPALRKPTKFLLHNTNLLHVMGQYLGKAVSKGMERELFFLQSLDESGRDLFYSKEGDYRTRDEIFEIEGKSKTRKQIKEASLPAYLVKDEIIQPLKGEVPLFLFGFLY